MPFQKAKARRAVGFALAVCLLAPGVVLPRAAAEAVSAPGIRWAADAASLPSAEDWPEASKHLFVSGGNVYRREIGKRPTLVFIAPYVPSEDGETYRKLPIQGLREADDQTFLFRSGDTAYCADIVPISTTLKILNNEVALECDAHDDYLKENPYITLQWVDYEDTHTVPDIYPCMNEFFSGLSYLRRNENALPLRSAAALAEHARYFPAAREVLRYADGMPFAVPVTLRLNPWFVHEEMWAALGAETLPTTLEACMELLAQWEAECKDTFPGVPFMGEYWPIDARVGLLFLLKNQFIYEQDDGLAPFNFDTAAFRALIDMALALPKDFEDPAYGSYAVIRSCNDVDSFWLTYREMTRGGIPQLGLGPEYRWFLPPIISNVEIPRIGALMQVMTIPTAAENPALAEEYINYRVTHRQQGQPDLLYMLTGENPEAVGVDKAAHEAYQTLIPLITFHTNAVGGVYASSDLAGDFYTLKNTDDDPPEVLAEKVDALIDRLNELSQYLFERQTRDWLGPKV